MDNFVYACMMVMAAISIFFFLIWFFKWIAEQCQPTEEVRRQREVDALLFEVNQSLKNKGLRMTDGGESVG